MAHSPAFVPVKHRNADHAHVAVAPCDLSSPVCLNQAVPPLSDARIASTRCCERRRSFVPHCNRIHLALPVEVYNCIDSPKSDRIKWLADDNCALFHRPHAVLEDLYSVGQGS